MSRTDGQLAVPARTDWPPVPTPPAPDAGPEAVGPWLAELHRCCSIPGWSRWYVATYCPPPPPVVPWPNAYDTARERWNALLGDHWRLLRGDGSDPSRMPEPLGGEQLRRLAATLLSPPTRALLRGLLLDLLADDITDVALTAAREVARGE